jgi:hypothetical protein
VAVCSLFSRFSFRRQSRENFDSIHGKPMAALD